MKAVIVGAELCGGSLAPALRGRGLTGKLHGDERAAEGLLEKLLGVERTAAHTAEGLLQLGVERSAVHTAEGLPHAIRHADAIRRIAP